MAEVAKNDGNNGPFAPGSSTVDVGLFSGPILRHPAMTDGRTISSSRVSLQDVSDGATVIADGPRIGSAHRGNTLNGTASVGVPPDSATPAHLSGGTQDTRTYAIANAVAQPPDLHGSKNGLRESADGAEGAGAATPGSGVRIAIAAPRSRQMWENVGDVRGGEGGDGWVTRNGGPGGTGTPAQNLGVTTQSSSTPARDSQEAAAAARNPRAPASPPPPAQDSDSITVGQSTPTTVTAQARFIKETQDAFRLHHKYPSTESFMIYPPDGKVGDTLSGGDSGVDEDSSRRPIFVWRPELAFPEAFEGGRPPCPRCKTSEGVVSKGWMQHGSRVGILRDGSCDLTCYWYQCRKCQDDNKRKPKSERVPEAFKGWDSGVLAQLPQHVQAMFPFVLRTRSALHVDVASCESRA